MPPVKTPIVDPEKTPVETPLEEPKEEATPVVEVQTPEPVVSVRELTDDEVLARIASMDRKKLLSHNTVAGIIGSTADDIQRRRQADFERQQAMQYQQAENQRLLKLREESPIEYVDELKKKEVEDKHRRIADAQTDAVLHDQFSKLPLAIQEKLQLRQWPSRQDYLAEVTDLLADHKASLKTQSDAETERARVKADADKALTEERAKDKAERTKWENETREALRKELLSATVGSEPTPDGGSASTPARGAMTQEEWDLNRRNLGWRQQNAERMRDALKAGRITH